MHGTDEVSGSLFSCTELKGRIITQHSLRNIWRVFNEALAASLDSTLDALCTDLESSSIAPERRIRVGLIWRLFSVRSERQHLEQMQYNFLLHWFVSFRIDGPVWAPTVATKNRDRLLIAKKSRKVMATILAHRDAALPLPANRFPVGDALVKSWASMKSFQPESVGTTTQAARLGPPHEPPSFEDDTTPCPDSQFRSAEVDSRDEKWAYVIYASTANRGAHLYKKSPSGGAMLYLIDRAPMKGYSGLMEQGDLIHADGQAERRAELDNPPLLHQITSRTDICGDRGLVWPSPSLPRPAPQIAQSSRCFSDQGRLVPRRERRPRGPDSLYREAKRIRSCLDAILDANNLARLPQLLAA